MLDRPRLQQILDKAAELPLTCPSSLLQASPTLKRVFGRGEKTWMTTATATATAAAANQVTDPGAGTGRGSNSYSHPQPEAVFEKLLTRVTKDRSGSEEGCSLDKCLKLVFSGLNSSWQTRNVRYLAVFLAILLDPAWEVEQLSSKAAQKAFKAAKKDAKTRLPDLLVPFDQDWALSAYVSSLDSYVHRATVDKLCETVRSNGEFSNCCRLAERISADISRRIRAQKNGMAHMAAFVNATAEALALDEVSPSSLSLQLTVALLRACVASPTAGDWGKLEELCLALAGPTWASDLILWRWSIIRDDNPLHSGTFDPNAESRRVEQQAMLASKAMKYALEARCPARCRRVLKHFAAEEDTGLCHLPNLEADERIVLQLGQLFSNPGLTALALQTLEQDVFDLEVACCRSFKPADVQALYTSCLSAL